MQRRYLTARGPLPSGVKLDENIYVTMSDGIKIAVDIYHPEIEGRFPALLSMSPYIKEIQQQPPELSHDIEAGATGFFVPKGYVHIVAQIRGTGFSQGQYNFLSAREQQDGYEMVEWIAKQSWCDGNVGMMGDSYFAMIQYLIAAQQPPHLKCIAPFDGCTDPYRNFCYQGGLFNSWFLGMWGNELIRQCLWPGLTEGKLPPANVLVDWATNTEDGPYYWERAAWTKVEKIITPILSVTPLSVIHANGQLALYQKIMAPKKLIVVPPATGNANVHFIRNNALHQQLLRWYDYWLKNIDTGIMDEPSVAIYDCATEEWRYENEYPLARTNWTKFYFHSNASETMTGQTCGSMNTSVPEDEKPDVISYPQCLSLVYSGKPVLAYVTPPLDNDVKVWGPLSAIIHGSSTTVDTAWFVKLGDVGTDGKTTLLVEGHLKASFREVDESKSKPGQPFHPFQNPVAPEQDKIYEYQIELRPLFYTFKAGHKILVQISNLDLGYQLFLHTIYASEMLPVPAENMVYHDSKYASCLLLPVIPDAPILEEVEPPLSQIKWPAKFMA